MSAFPRQDLFTPVHKGLRLMLYDLGARVQGTDFSDAGSAEPMLAQIARAQDMLDEHGTHEDTRIFPVLELAEPGVCIHHSRQHARLQDASMTVSVAAEAVRSAPDDDARLAAGADLTRALDALIAMQLAHMNSEESETLPATWRLLTNEQLIGIRTSIVTSQPADRYADWLRWMFRAMNDADLVAIHRGAIRNAPLPVVQLFESVAAEVLDAGRLARIRKTAGL